MGEDATKNDTVSNDVSDNERAISDARRLLIDSGHHVLDSRAFFGLKEDAAKPYKAAALAAQEKLDALQAEHDRLAEFKRSIDDKGKSESELIAQRQAAWEQSNREKDEAIARAASEKDALEAQLRRERVQNKLSRLMTGSTNPDAAMMWAEKQIGAYLSTNDDGDLVWTDQTGIPHVGAAAKKMVSEWWGLDEQKFLRVGHEPGPPTSGAASAAPQKHGYQRPDPTKTSFAERKRYAMEHRDEWDPGAHVGPNGQRVPKNTI